MSQTRFIATELIALIRRRPLILNALVLRLKQQVRRDYRTRHFETSLIVQAVSWYLRYTLSYRDIEETLQGCGLNQTSRSEAKLARDSHEGTFSNVSTMNAASKAAFDSIWLVQSEFERSITGRSERIVLLHTTGLTKNYNTRLRSFHTYR